MKRLLLVLSLLMTVSLSYSTANRITWTQDNGGVVIDLRKSNEGQENPPQSLSQHLSATYYPGSGTIVINCQGYGNATVSILNPMLQVISSEAIDPSISTIAFLDAPTDSGRYVLLIVTSSFTAYGTFAVE